MKCAKCGKKAVFKRSPDLDVNGIGSCKKCDEAVALAVLILLTNGAGTKEFKRFTRGWRINKKRAA